MSVLTQAPSLRSRRPWRWPESLVVASVLVAVVASLPVMSVVSAVIRPDEVPGTWAHVVNTVLAPLCRLHGTECLKLLPAKVF